MEEMYKMELLLDLLLYAISEIVQFKRYFIILCGVFHTISEKHLKDKIKYLKKS